MSTSTFQDRSSLMEGFGQDFIKLLIGAALGLLSLTTVGLFRWIRLVDTKVALMEALITQFKSDHTRLTDIVHSKNDTMTKISEAVVQLVERNKTHEQFQERQGRIDEALRTRFEAMNDSSTQVLITCATQAQSINTVVKKLDQLEEKLDLLTERRMHTREEDHG